MRARAGLLAVASVLAAASLPLLLRAQPPSDRPVSLRGETLTGDALDLDEFRGSVVVLNVWASWCEPCEREQPMLERFWRQVRTRGVRVVGVNSGDARAEALAFARSYHVSYPSLYDPSRALARELGVTAQPATIVLDASGRIVRRISGETSATALTAAIAVAHDQPIGAR